MVRVVFYAHWNFTQLFLQQTGCSAVQSWKEVSGESGGSLFSALLPLNVTELLH